MNAPMYNKFRTQNIANPKLFNSIELIFKDLKLEIKQYNNRVYHGRIPEWNELHDILRMTCRIDHPINVVQFRKLAPDKANLWTDSRVKLHGLNNTNLVDLTNDKIYEYINRDYYLLPADEGDIAKANLLDSNINQSYILLPQTENGVINYKSFVPKNSAIYSIINLYDNIVYPDYRIITSDDLINYGSITNKIVKTTLGSGSRGIKIVDPNRQKDNYTTDKLTHEDINKLIAESYKHGCDIIVQDLIPNEYIKCNVDFIIRNRKLISYKWTVMNQNQRYTNWDNGYHLRSEWTDEVMNNVVDALIKNGITDAIMNFEGFMDSEDNPDKLHLVEFNWRYSNSMFEWESFGYDPIYGYIMNQEFFYDFGKYPFTRYWRCNHDKYLLQ